MAKIKLTLPGLEIPVDGKQVSFTAPCSCSAVDGIHIDGVDYDLVDSAGNIVPFGRWVWCEGAVLTVTLDVTNRKAYLQNQNAYTRYEALTPATAELFGMGADAVPDDVFSFLGKYNQHWWKRRAKETIHSVVKDSAPTSIVPFTTYLGSSVTVYYSDKVTTDGTSVSLVNPIALEFTSGNAQSVYTTLLGKYVTNVGTSSSSVATTNKVYFVASDATLTRKTSPTVWFNLADVYLCSVKTVVTTGEWEYVRSNDKNEYPNSGETGGYEYQYIGVPFDNAVTAPKIATGSYTGTGTYGASNPNSLTFDFEPKAVFVYGSSVQIYSGDTLVAFVGAGISSGDNSNQTKWYTLGGKTLSWYSTTNATGQLNNSGTVYRYIAIG